MIENNAVFKNEFDQPVSYAVENWQPAKFPQKIKLAGTFCTLNPLDLSTHGAQLFDEFSRDDSNWTYLPYGPFHSYDAFHHWLTDMTSSQDPLFYTILDNKNQQAIGLAGFLRINPPLGIIEVGHIHFSNRLKKTPAATEAMYLMMRYVFDELCYRRYEWKCDSLNQASRNAALRLGFKFEGIFRQDRIYKNRNRDTAWFSIIDSQWPELKSRFQKWLNPNNFDKNGNQLIRLREI